MLTKNIFGEDFVIIRVQYKHLQKLYFNTNICKGHISGGKGLYNES